MSVYRRSKSSQEYSYDFWLDGVRFSGPTGKTEKRAAESYEREVARPSAERERLAARTLEKALRGDAPLQLGPAAALWFEQAGKHHSGAESSLTDINRMVEHFGHDKHLSDIRDPDIAAWVASRRSDTRWGKTTKKGEQPDRISNATVNRTTVKRASALFAYARKAWGLRFENEPVWSNHLLGESTPKPREIDKVTINGISDQLAEGYRDYMAFALVSGLRLENCILRWSQIDWEQRIIRVVQKGKRELSIPVSNAMAAILARCRGHDSVFVFTYIARRRGGGKGNKAATRLLGERYPVTYSGMKSAWRGACKRAKAHPRFHDLRHTRAMSLLRKTSNLKIVQQLLGHASITTTATFYAHALAEDIRAGLDLADTPASHAVPPKVPRKIRDHP